MTLWLGIVLVAIIVNVVDQLIRDRANRIVGYFRAAVKAYALAGDERARLAALTAGKVASGAQRQSMVEYLEYMVAAAPRDLAQAAKDILTDLADEIRSKDWTASEAAAAKAELGARAPEYLAALDRADADVFQRSSR